MTIMARTTSGGFDLELRLERGDLLPGRLVDGSLLVTSRGNDDIRGARVTLIGTERWRYDRITTDSKGHTQTETVTADDDLPSVPVRVSGATAFRAGETREIPFQVPVPALGPPTFDATEFGVSWQLRANLDIGGVDPAIATGVQILQPTALLRAGVLQVAEFALHPEADAADDGFAGSSGSIRCPSVSGLRSRAGSRLARPHRVRYRRSALNSGSWCSQR